MFSIGIDVGGTNLVAGVVDESCQILSKAKRPTAPERGAEAVLDDMDAIASEAADRIGLKPSDIAWIGVGCPGTHNKKTGEIVYANNIPFRNTPMVAALQKNWSCPVYIENDANAAALGEAYAGAAKGAQHAVMITLGTGLGGGIIIDRKVYAGFNDAAGELGHMVIAAGGQPCTCGRKGCWEAYSSASGLIRMTREAMKRNSSSALWRFAETLDQANGRTAFLAMRQGDAEGKAVVDEYLRYLACGVGSILNIFQPEILVIGGGISHEGDLLLDLLNAAIKDEVYTRDIQQTQFRLAVLGNDAGLIGAAMLGRQI